MQPDWKKFLQERGAIIEGDQVVRFDNVDAEAYAAVHGNIICDLSHYGLIRATGADTADFLQGQLTNDVRQVSATTSQLTAYCSPKGRVLGILRLWSHANGYLLKLPLDRLQTVAQRLQMYVLRAEVELGAGNTNLIQVGLAGSDIADMLFAMGVEVPAQIDEVSTSGDLSVLRVNGGRQARYEVTAGPDRLQQLWDELAGATPTGANAWGLLDVLAGIPEIYTATADLFVPQMVNLHNLGAVSFSKGCYTGQEIVARSHYLGTVKRHLVRARGTGGGCPQPGTTLADAQSADGAEFGRVVSAHTDELGHTRLLAVVQQAAAENVELGWEGDQGTNLISVDTRSQKDVRAS